MTHPIVEAVAGKMDDLELLIVGGEHHKAAGVLVAEVLRLARDSTTAMDGMVYKLTDGVNTACPLWRAGIDALRREVEEATASSGSPPCPR